MKRNIVLRCVWFSYWRITWSNHLFALLLPSTVWEKRRTITG